MQSHGIGNQVFLDTAGDVRERLVAPLGRLVVADQLPEDDPQREVITAFVDDYTAEYDEGPSTFAGHAYDGWQLAVDALREVGTDKQALRDHLEGVEDFVGISGTFTMSPEDHSGLTKEALVLVTIENGEWTLFRIRAPDPAVSSGGRSSAGRGADARRRGGFVTDLLQLVFAGLSQGAVYALIAIGFVSIFTVSGVINLAQGEFAALAGLVAISAVGSGLPLLAAAVLAVVTVAIVAVLMERLAIAPGEADDDPGVAHPDAGGLHRAEGAHAADLRPERRRPDAASHPVGSTSPG